MYLLASTLIYSRRIVNCWSENFPTQQQLEFPNFHPVDCKCVKITGHLDVVNWQLWPRDYRPSAGPLALGDWTKDPFIWLYYVESSDGKMRDEDVLLSTDTRYWNIHDVQRYFVGELHCEQVLFTYQYPNLRMPTRHGSYLWKANNALKLPSNTYMKELHISVEETLKDNLQLVSFENLCCKRLEGIKLIQQLACFNANTLKYLFLWRFVLPNENPILINYSYITGSGQYILRPPTRDCFLRSLGELKNLRVLALEYSHIADGTGGALIAILPVIKRPHFRLQLICRENHTPGRGDAALGTGGYVIPDTAWRRVNIACPDLYVLMVFFRIRDYDNVRRFLTPSIPLRETHLQLGIDVKMEQRQDSDISCFVRHIAYCYANTLVTLSIHQWQFATLPLRRVFELMPRLVRFLYVGRVEDDVDLRRMLEVVACGVCEKLKQIQIQIHIEESKKKYWETVVKNVNEEYSSIMKLYDINFCISIYKN